MNKKQIIDRLLTNGDISIQYRIKKEILGYSPQKPEMQYLQNNIVRKNHANPFSRCFKLEDNWRKKERRINDIYFRFLIILYYSGILEK